MIAFLSYTLLENDEPSLVRADLVMTIDPDPDDLEASIVEVEGFDTVHVKESVTLLRARLHNLGYPV